MVNVYCDDKEWIRRRQMRIMQVRKQSNDIAKRLRERVIDEERQRRLKEKNLIEAKLHIWKVKRLKNLEEMYRKAISDFGAGHKVAAEKPDPGEERKEKHREYLCKAKERGESARELQLKEKKEAAEKKLIPIQRKIITRKIENLRSSLVCSIPVKEPSLILRDIYAGKIFDPKKFENYEFEEPIKNKSKPEEKAGKCSSEECFPAGKIGPGKRKIRKKAVKQIKPKSRVICDSNEGKTSKVENPRCEDNWVNLGAIETLTKEEEITDEKVSVTNLKETGSGKGSRKEKISREKEMVLKSDVLTKKVNPIKQKSVIECHGVSLPHSCKLKDSICVVQNPRNISEPNAIELALKEEERLLLKENEKATRENAAEERGNKALEKQKIIKNYNELLMKLEKLSTKEKLIKSYCHIPPAHLFFSDERRKEKAARKQRIMDSEFERIYYDVTGAKPDSHLNTQLNFGASIDVKADSESESVVTKLDFSKLDSNLKTNSPASSIESKSQTKPESNRVRSPVEEVLIKKTPSSFHFKRTKIIKGDSQALVEIDKILKKCQELRQESRNDRDPRPRQPGSESSEKKADLNLEAESTGSKSTESGSIELQFCKSDTPSLCDGNRVSDINCLKKSPRKNLSPQEKAVLEDLAMGDVPRNFVGFRNNVAAWPVQEIRRTVPVKRSSGRSSSTSYRSLPSEIHPKRVNSLLEILAVLKEREGRCVAADELIIELENLLGALVRDAERNNLDMKEKHCRDFENNPRLSYYISKLLHMSRETVAELSLSSESDTSVPNIPTFCDDKEDRTVLRSENKYLKQMNDNSKISRITRAKELEEIIEKWKNLLEQSLKSCTLEEELSLSDADGNAPECTKENEEKNEEKYEDIAKICSERMAVLSRVLDNLMNKGYVKKPEQEDGQIHGDRDDNIQVPPHEGQNYVVGPENKESESFYQKKENKECPGSKSPRTKKLNFCDDRICPFRVPFNDGNNVNCQKSRVQHSPDTSLESLPNVMEELLKKKIITSPFRWSQGNVLSDYSPKGSCHSRKSKDGSIHDGMKRIKQVNNLPVLDKDEQECPKPKVNNGLYQPYKCKDSCKGSCATGANNFRELKESAKKLPVPEKIVLENVPEFQTKVINRPQKRKGPISYRDSVYGIFSPVPRYCRVRSSPKRANVTPEMYPAHPDELFNKKTFTSRYVWDEDTRNFIVNPNGGVPAVHRPFWEPGYDIPNSPGITITSVKKNSQGAPKRPRSSPVRGHDRDWGGTDCTDRPVNPYKTIQFNGVPFDRNLNLMDSEEPDKDVMQEWMRRNKASRLFDRNAGGRDYCAGSCAVHCKNGYSSFGHCPRSSFHGGNIRVESCHRGANSSPDVREYETGPGREAEFSPIRYEYQEEYGEDVFEDSEDCENYDDAKWAQDLFQDPNGRRRF